jgi:PAS domain S-box-containing protein
MNHPVRILHVDDSPRDRDLVRDALARDQGAFALVSAASRTDIESALADGACDLVLSDVSSSGLESLQVLDVVHARDTRLPVVIVTGSGSVEIAIEAMKRGAADYVTKTPQHIQHLPHTIHAVLALQRLDEDRDRAAAVLRQSEASNRAILASAMDCIIAIDHEGRVIEFNRAAERTFGYTRAEVLGRDMADLIIPPALRADHRGGLAHYLATSESRIMGKRIELTAVRKDGEEFPVELTITRIAGTEPPTFTGFVRDITELRQLQQQSLQAHRMETVGRLAGGVAHDFNNLLTVINNTATLAAMQLVEHDPLQQEFREIRDAGERAALLTRQLLAFSRQQILQPAITSLNVLVAGVSEMLRRLIGEHIALAITTAEDTAPVKVDAGQFEQVIVNLVVNARDAMPDGGTLTIETRNAVVQAPEARRLSISPGPHVMLAVSDTGAGIDAATCERIFEPFFTTKAAGEGTGLGLATSYGIVKQSGGSLSVRSQIGRGSTFTIYLPHTEGAVPPARPLQSTAVMRGTETILLVEDEEAVRRLVERLLVSAGYQVLAAASGSEALAALERHDGSVDLVITDVVMPGMSGPELAKQIARRRPGLKVLFTSGFASDAIGAMGEAAHFIGKPYSIAELARKVREVLESAGNGFTPG